MQKRRGGILQQKLYRKIQQTQCTCMHSSMTKNLDVYHLFMHIKEQSLETTRTNYNRLHGPREGVGRSSDRKAWHNTNTSWISQSEKGLFFSAHSLPGTILTPVEFPRVRRDFFSVHTLLQCSDRPRDIETRINVCVHIKNPKHLQPHSCLTHENTAHTGRKGRHCSHGCCRGTLFR